MPRPPHVVRYNLGTHCVDGHGRGHRFDPCRAHHADKSGTALQVWGDTSASRCSKPNSRPSRSTPRKRENQDCEQIGSFEKSGLRVRHLCARSGGGLQDFTGDRRGVGIYDPRGRGGADVWALTKLSL